MSEKLEAQEDRGLDSIGIVNLSKNSINKGVRKTLTEYKKFISGLENKGFVIMHHRKASIGKVNMDNCHPFYNKKFCLFQNGTSRIFYRENVDKYKKGTDSENIFEHISSTCNNLDEAVIALDKICMTDQVGIIILVDIITKQLLIYTDGARESWIKIQNGLLKEYSNYEDGKDEGYKNIGYIITDFDGKIIKKEFEDKLNTITFYVPPTKTEPIKYKSSGYSNRGSSWDDRDDYGGWEQMSISSNKGSELFDSGLSISIINKLASEGITSYTQLLELSINDITSSKLTYTEGQTVMKLLKAWGVVIEDNNNGIDDLFYSEEILKDDGLLYSDIVCYLYRCKTNGYSYTLKGYAYENMNIDYNVGIKRIIGKKDYKRMKKLYASGLKKVFKQETNVYETHV